MISSIHTLSAKDMIRLLAKGATDQEQLLNCAKGKVNKKKDQLAKALNGALQTYHHTQLQMLMEDYDHVQKQVDFLDKSIIEIISKHYAEAFGCLDCISGIGVKSAEIIISEAGTDMSRFQQLTIYSVVRHFIKPPYHQGTAALICYYPVI